MHIFLLLSFFCLLHVSLSCSLQGRVVRPGAQAPPGVPGTQLTDRGATRVHAAAQRAYQQAYEAGVRDMGWHRAMQKGVPSSVTTAANNAYYRAYVDEAARITNRKFNLAQLEDGLRASREAFVDRAMPEIRARAFAKSSIVNHINSPAGRGSSWDTPENTRKLMERHGRYAYSAGHLQDHVVNHGWNIPEERRLAHMDSFDNFLGAQRVSRTPH